MTLHIGLVNNMPDAAVEATERQFRQLLTEAADGMQVQLSLFALSDLPRTPRIAERMQSLYKNEHALWDSHLDGLIVTGAEPLAARLPEERYWRGLTRVVEWSQSQVRSVIFSCLAAHAAVLHLDGIERAPLGSKLFGVFDCEVVETGLPLCADLPRCIRVPHSRWNHLNGDALNRAGYRILTLSPIAGVDAFVRENGNLQVFFQGHPEYDAGTLPLEYRRDLRRYLTGEASVPPTWPSGFPAPANEVAGIRNTWRSDAVRMYRNWLEYLAGQDTCIAAMPTAAGRSC